MSPVTTHEGAEQNDAELLNEEERAIHAFRPAVFEIDEVDLAGFTLQRPVTNEPIWLVFDRRRERDGACCALDPQRFPTSRHLLGYLKGERERLNSGDQDTAPETETNLAGFQ